MHTTIKYKGTQEEKDRKALIDAVQWLGLKRYKLLARTAKAKVVDEQQFKFYCSFAGMQGLPVRAMWRRYT